MAKIENGYVYYRNEIGQLHRLNGPAFFLAVPAFPLTDAKIAKTGNWRLNGNFHRYYGPAEYDKSWYIHDKFIKNEKQSS